MNNLSAATSSDIMEQVKQTYSDAAEAPQPGLCCPQPLPSESISHIPDEAFDHNYGCGSPVLQANIKSGDVVVDLGSGVGIDSFVAAKLVGKTGKVYGIDMTDAMLSKAVDFGKKVSKKLGYDVVEFRKGVIEKLPLEDNSVDIVVSNCVLNLSETKDVVFKEIHRVLKHGGRMVVSDIVSDREITSSDSQDKESWAACELGAMSLKSLLNSVTDTGFVSLNQIEEKNWQEVKGYNLASVTIEASKFEQDCNTKPSHLAIYTGPYASVKDDMDNEYFRFKPRAITESVATYLESSNEQSSFILIKGKSAPVEAEVAATPCCNPDDKVTQCCEDNQPKADGSPCCDPYAAEQPADCGCSPAATAPKEEEAAACCDSSSGCGEPAPAPKEEAAACCDSSSGCGEPAPAPKEEAAACCDSSSGCGEPAVAKATVAVSEDDSCCGCADEAEATGTDCCGSGCNTCGCEES